MRLALSPVLAESALRLPHDLGHNFAVSSAIGTGPLRLGSPFLHLNGVNTGVLGRVGGVYLADFPDCVALNPCAKTLKTLAPQGIAGSRKVVLYIIPK
ncbi:MAG: hypothetical protein C7B46_19395 [Sulfobacillus benefaciens]|uniref:Uncharacterized protein n=1 Tax=Sulfobacillus benefaciens TaxID=453960 RepID=A0A2T2WZA1_9FIRM|nr:MAG: hypothetical protein C7B46_19395 [Sulfobacillus benefaciens]